MYHHLFKRSKGVKILIAALLIHFSSQAQTFERVEVEGRGVWVYLPENYKATKSYKTIYMLDGQNLFDPKAAYAGIWEVSENLEKLREDFIVIGIENGGANRIEEYTPDSNEKYGGGKADQHLGFIINKIIPWSISEYSCTKKSKHRAIIGSSLGGLFALYAGLEHPEVFSKIGALSTSFWFNTAIFERINAANLSKKQRFVLITGAEEGPDMTQPVVTAVSELISREIPYKNVYSEIVPEGKHQEWFWAQELNKTIKFLYKL